MAPAQRVHAQPASTRAILGLASLFALAALALLLFASTVRAAEVNGYGELTRFGETGSAGEAGKLNELSAHSIGVDPTDNSVYLLDEPEEGTNTKRHLRLQKFTAAGGKYSLAASVQFTVTASAVGGVEPTVDGLAVDPVEKRVYLLLVDVRKKTLNQASRTQGGEGLLVASTLYAFSTEASGSNLVEAPGTKAGGVVIGPGAGELEAQSEQPGEALLQPHGIAVDPATHEVIVLAHMDEGSEKEDNVASAKDHYVLQRIHSNGTLGARYIDKTNVLKTQGEFEFLPLPNSPVAVSAGGEEHVYVDYGGLAEIPYDFTSSAAPTLLPPSKNPSFGEGIESGISSAPEGGRLTAAPDGTVYGANTSGIVNEESGTQEGRAGVVAFSGLDGSEIGWTGGQQLHEAEPKEQCVISPLIYSLSERIAAGSEGKLFVLAPEFLMRQVEGEPIIKMVENPPGSGEFEEVIEPTFEPLPGPFFPGVIEFGPGGTGCPQASATAPVAKVNSHEIQGEEAVLPGSEVTFTSHLKQGDALKVKWNFGDGAETEVTKDEGQTTVVKHKYEHEGKFTVTETISSDDLAASDQPVYKAGQLVTPTITETRTLVVHALPPTAGFTAPTTRNTGEAVSFESHSTDPNGAGALPLEYTWSFGDGTPETTPSTATTATHSFAQPGLYTVTLTVTDQFSLKSSIAHSISITVTQPSGGGGGGGGGTGGGSGGGGTGGNGGGTGGGGQSYQAGLASTALAVNPTGALTLKVSCLGQSSCSGTVTLRTLSAVSAGAKKHKKAILTLASGSFTIAGGQVQALTLHLSAKARKLLAHLHVLRAQATIVGHDSAGAIHTTQMVVTLRAAKSKHR